MLSLTFGLIAACAWGLHDFCVRLISARTAALPALLLVLGAGTLILMPLALIWGDWPAMTPRAYGLAVASGLAYILGAAGMYLAFAIGPVNLVAPITGAYPMLSLAWAALRGQPVTPGQWIAVLAVVAGIGVVAVTAQHHGPASGRRRSAILWACAGAAGFALTFGIGQAATAAGSGVPVQLIGRATAFAGLGAILILLRRPMTIYRPHLPLLAGMGLLDATALGFVLAAGSLPRPEFAAVASASFGILTILLAWRFLHEPMTRAQWAGVAVVFAGIGYLAI